VLAHRPGQVVALDTTVLPVTLRDGVFGDPVKCHLTIALDVYSHSLVAFRLTLVSDSCGTRLDQPGQDHFPRPSPDALNLQKRLLALLSPEQPAWEAAHAFADLRLISTLLCMSWPVGRNLTDPCLAGAVDEHADRLGHGYHQSMDRAPVTIQASAGLLTAAAAIRGSNDLEGAIARPADA
jgi:hypothetical protein